ncbi:MAG TPA: hypothetical protein PLD54_01475 [Candidatus Levybacteria bacterium]|nr:hypothetical protein [Candidatus Levybacteria bacterium]
MSGLFSFLYTIFFIALLISIFCPSLITKFIERSKKTLILVNGGLFFFFFTLTGLTTPATTVQGIQEERDIPTPTIVLAVTPTNSPTQSPTDTPVPTSEPINTPSPTKRPTAIPTQYVPPTTKPTQIVIPTTPPQQPTVDTGGSFSCNCAKTCPQMSSCAEAQYQLNVCGCKARDADKDGIACDAQCQ